MATLAEFNAAAQSAIDAYSQAVIIAQPFISGVLELSSADACVIGFDQRIEEVKAKETAINNFLAEATPPRKADTAFALYRTLSSSEKSTAEALRERVLSSMRTFSLSTSPLRTFSLAAVEAKFKACTTLKDPNAAPTTPSDTKTDTPVDTTNKNTTDTDKNATPGSQNAAPDDDSYDKKDAARLPNLGKVTTNGGSPQQQASSGGTTTAGSGQGAGTTNPQQQQDGDAPGKRLKNPLGDFSSHNYRLTLYMITPEAHATFVNSGRKFLDPNGEGVYVVAQSAGVNNTDSKRVPGIDFDYYIDDLKLTNSLGGEGNSTSATWEWSFTITEPYGFSFVSKLAEGYKTICSKSPIASAANSSNGNPTKSYYIIAIRFYGYDKDGNIVIKSEIPYERFYDIYISSLKFTLDGKATVYRITAADVGQAMGFGTQKGQVNNPTKIKAKNVGEALTGPDGLITKLNEREKKLTEQKDSNGVPIQRVANIYDVVFEGPDAERIKNAAIIEMDKLMVPMSIASNTEYVNDGTSIRSVPDFVNKTFTVDGGTPILQAIENIIVRSKYIQDAIKTSNESNEEPSKNGELKSTPNSKKVPLKWIRVVCKGTTIDYDKSINDYAMKLVFVITSYEIPLSNNPFASSATPYPGPFKRYEYWLTGQNTEVRKFEQTLNNLYYLSDIVGGTTKNSTVPHVPNQKGGQDPSGKVNNNMAPEASVLTSLQDLGSWARSKLSILGDPDFLMQPYSGGSKYYGPDGYTVNPNNSQVFIEINFHEAVDYNYDAAGKKTTESGLLTVNPFISFYTPNVTGLPPGLKGVSFLVIKCVSTFSRGHFTQELELNLNQFPNGYKNDNGTSSSGTTTSSDGGRQQTMTPEAEALARRYPPPTKTTGLATDKQTDKSQTPVAPSTPMVAQNTNATGSTKDDAQQDVNTRIKIGIGLQQGRETDSLINRGRRILGIPVGGTGNASNPGGGG